MSFNQRSKTIALAIVKIFETSKPFGDYSAVAVLDDGAGISYGTSQFTHKSGSLAAVIERYEKISGDLPSPVKSAMPDLQSGKNITKRSGDNALKSALRRLGKTPEMQQAQREIAFEKYLKPSIEACEGSDFVLPLSLAVIYDSKNHGSYDKIRDRVKLNLPASIKPIEFEKEWITAYVQKRDAWLESVPRLKKTDYRTDFFLAQIARGNWNLDLPLNVHGFRLTEEILFPTGSAAEPAGEKPDSLTEIPSVVHSPGDKETHSTATAADDSPSDSIVEKTEVETSAGESAVSTTTKNEQDINTPAVVNGVQPYNEIGLKDTLKGDAKAILPANLGLNTFSEVIQQTTGWPAWVSALIPKLVIGALIVTAVWLLYRLFSYLMHNWRENERVKLLAHINSDPKRKDLQLQ